MKNLATAIATSGHLIEQNKQGLSVEDVFSTYLYTGNGATQSIVNGIDLSTEGGMVWQKSRTGSVNHFLTDTDRGATWVLNSNTTNAAVEENAVTGFNVNGFDLGSYSLTNTSGQNYASWTFRKAPRFFDVVKYTGNGVAGREIAHDLGCDVGMIIVKSTNVGFDPWYTYHKSLGSNYELRLSETDYAVTPSTRWNNTAPSDTVFTVDGGMATNVDTREYVAYLFADDPLGESGDGSDGLIACGSFTQTDTGFTSFIEVDLGWEIQYLLRKKTNEAGNWQVFDNIRGMGETVNEVLSPNLSSAESTYGDPLIVPTATGFKYRDNAEHTYIYMAIRRGMRTPESSDEVFAIDNAPPSANNSGFPVDFYFSRALTASGSVVGSRLTAGKTLAFNSTAAEAADAAHGFDSNVELSVSSYTDYWHWMWKRATGFFDVVAYTGDGTAERAVPHNLGVVPNMIITKSRSVGAIRSMWFLSTDVANTGWGNTLTLNEESTLHGGPHLDSVSATSFITPSNVIYSNENAIDYIAYLFATLAGISKVGSYTGNGTSQTIDCGFSAGAKFIIIKRRDDTGDWFMWDSVRGIVAGNDPHLSLNTTAAEVTSDDSIDPDSTGFIVNQVAVTNINVSSATYIFYAIA